MKHLEEATLDPPVAAPQRPTEPLAVIDLDRFCEECAYNLRTLPVHRDSRTGIPVVRCPECGRYQAANDASTALRPWLQRVSALLLWVWILTILAAFFFAGLGEGAISYATLDELTQHEGSKMQRFGNTTIRTWTGSGPLEIRTDMQDYDLFIFGILITSFAIAFVCGVFVVVVCPHWPRAAYAGLVLGLSLAAGIIAAATWRYEALHLFDWGVKYIAAHFGVQAVGGLAGICIGRPLARLAVRILLPPGLRPRLAYLWLADDKPFPRP